MTTRTSRSNPAMTNRILCRAALTGALSLLFTASVQAGADAPLPKDLPPYAPDKPLPVQDIAQKTLDAILDADPYYQAGVVQYELL